MIFPHSCVSRLIKPDIQMGIFNGYGSMLERAGERVPGRGELA